MTLDEAIAHANGVAHGKDACDACRAEHLQLREWLNSLKEAKVLLADSYEWFSALRGENESPAGLISELMEKIRDWKKTLDIIGTMA